MRENERSTQDKGRNSVNKIIVLIFIGHYVPGYKAGGGIRSIQAMTERLKNRIDFKIITGDRDLGMDSAYKGIQLNHWIKVGGSEVMYLSPEHQSLVTYRMIIAETDHDIQYFTSFWSPNFTWKAILSQLGAHSQTKPKCLSPKGEFTEGALSRKKIKKIVFSFFVSQLQFLKKINWHASSEKEFDDIQRQLVLFDRINLSGGGFVHGAAKRKFIAKDLGILASDFVIKETCRIFKSGGRLKICLDSNSKCNFL
jgi:hypothetical protein